ncbi:hypothetical protein ACI2I2_19125 [Scandinavium sp. NPDC088450]|uniref:hypothetical protein n=1 Tax=Scandinavium sp. NPDC088450 TaxID=3364514 RepID=UPI00384EB744
MMIKRLQLRTNRRPASPGSKIGWVVAILFIVLISCAGGWYYFVYTPAQEKAKALHQEQEQLAKDIKAIDAFYLKELSGGSVQRFTELANEIVESSIILQKFNYVDEVFTCTAENCVFSYKLGEGGVFNVAQKIFWGEVYTVNYSDSTYDFTGIKSRLDSNPVLTAYKNKQNAKVYPCGDLLSYVYSYNSAFIHEMPLTIKSPPSSSILALEEKIVNKGKLKLVGLSFIPWEVKLSSVENTSASFGYINILYLASFFERQAYKDAFIIKKIDTAKENNITGVMVCKSGK